VFVGVAVFVSDGRGGRWVKYALTDAVRADVALVLRVAVLLGICASVGALWAAAVCLLSKKAAPLVARARTIRPIRIKPPQPGARNLCSWSVGS